MKKQAKILLLSCKTGEGHNSAALAVAEGFAHFGAESRILDPVSVVGEKTRRGICGLYNRVIQDAPSLFGAAYRAGELWSDTFPRSPVYLANSLYASRMLSAIREGGYDAVVSTHLYGMEVMTAIRRKLGVPVPSFGVLTDYTCIPFFRETDQDAWFVPHGDLCPDMRHRGMPAERLIVTGMPVSERFSRRMSREMARSRLGLEQDRRVYLVMTGGAGCGNVAAICDGLLAEDSGRFCAYVLAGNNATLRRKLSERYPTQTDQIRVLGFTREVDLFMAAADVLITKPGGLSSTEAAVFGIPLVHLISIPGCEEYNAAFFAAHGMCEKTADARESAHLAVRLASDPAACARMRAAQAAQMHPLAARDIAARVLSFPALCGQEAD